MRRAFRAVTAAILAGVFLLGFDQSARSDDNAAANRLFIEAVETWESAWSDDATLAERLERVRAAKANLERITKEHPDSFMAVILVMQNSRSSGPFEPRWLDTSIKRIEACMADANKPDCALTGYLAGRYPASRVKTENQEPKTVRIVAAKQMLRPGDRLTFETGKEVLKFVEWPVSAVPWGAYKSAEELFGEDKDWVRHVTRQVEPGELLLISKVTKPDDPAPPRPEAGEKRLFAVSGADGIGSAELVDVILATNTDGKVVRRVLLLGVPVVAASGDRVEIEVRSTDIPVLELARNIGELRLEASGE